MSRRASAAESWVQVRYRDDQAEWSDWSDAVGFTTGANAPPAAPAITSPGQNATGVSRSPQIVASAFSDPDGDSHLSSDWEIFDSPSLGAGTRVAHGLGDATNKTSITVDPGGFVFENALGLETTLAASTEYWARVTYRDACGATASSALVHFVTGLNKTPSMPTIVTPSPDSTGVALNPTVITAPYSDPDGDAHASTSWEIYEDAGVTLVACSTADTLNLTSISVDPAGLVFQGSLSGAEAPKGGTEYWARACFTDDLGATGDWSTLARFENGVYPSNQLWPYYGSGCVPGQGRSGIGAWGTWAMVAAILGLAMRRGRRP